MSHGLCSPWGAWPNQGWNTDWLTGKTDWSRHSCCSPPNMPLRCHCGGPLSPGTNAMPKLASAVNIPAYTHSSCSGGGMARASLEDEDVRG